MPRRTRTRDIQEIEASQSRRWGPPCKVAIAERDKVMACEQRSFTGMWLGDPMLGRSALDRKRLKEGDGA